jgi:hypothetical protein
MHAGYLSAAAASESKIFLRERLSIIGVFNCKGK